MQIGISFASLVVTLALAWPSAAQQSTQASVDAALEAVQRAATVGGLAEVAEIDHARLAAGAGVEMGPSRVLILSDPAISTPILEAEVRAGVDLPFRVLSFDDAGTARVIYTDFAFLAARHGLEESDAGAAFDARLAEVLAAADVEATAAPVEGLARDFGVLELASAHGFDATVERLRSAIVAQDDTVWFGIVDYTADAAALGATLPRATLLLFGGPAPGGVAMKDFPAIGLDAFCQKILVFEGPEGAVRVIYNDIAALATLHYGTSAKPHHALNERLTATFAKALE